MVLTDRGPELTPVAFLVHGLEDASVRYRVTQFVLPLQGEGIDIRTFPIPRGLGPRLALFRRLGSYPLVVVQRKLFSAGYLHLLRRGVPRLIYDFDDALFIRDSREQSRPSWTRRRRFARTLRQADRVIAGNRSLQEAARHHNPRVDLLPTCIDTDRYSPVPPGRRKTGEVTIGWIGSRSTFFYLEDLAPTLEEVPAPGLPEIRLKIIADRFLRLERVEVIPKEWREEDEVEDLASVDIGIMPLRDDLWSRGKCGLKLLQYMAMGIPVVCTPVGVNREMVTPGVEGLHARDREGWVESIRRLAADPDLRRALGMQGRRKVEAKYSVARLAGRFASILRATARGGRG